MLEYFAYKKVKKHRAHKGAEKEARRQAESVAEGDDAVLGPPVLGPEDESFLEELLASADGPAPPLPPRHHDAELYLASDNEAAASTSGPSKGEELAAASKTADKAAKKPNRLSLLFTRQRKNQDGLKPEGVPLEEGEREKQDLGRVLDCINLSAQNNKVISTQSSEMLRKFTQVFKDLVNGVPTAYDDLAKLVEDRDGTLSRGFDKLPSSLKKLVTQLPDKITGSLAPEILAAAAGSQGIKADATGGLKGTAKKVLLPHNLAELVTKPGAIVGMLRAIVEVLKTRWPAFIGMNVLWSVALSLLLFVLWYCHKRGREVRLEREKLDSDSVVDGGHRIEELPDDPALPAPGPRVAEAGAEAEELPRPLAAEPGQSAGSRLS